MNIPRESFSQSETRFDSHSLQDQWSRDAGLVVAAPDPQ